MDKEIRIGPFVEGEKKKERKEKSNLTLRCTKRKQKDKMNSHPVRYASC